MSWHTHPIRIYYEDTDFSGVVYHANYLKYFERAREHLIGIDKLVRLYEEEGIGFVVYKAELTYRAAAFHGDSLEIRTRIETTTPYRAIFDQSAWRAGGDAALVEGSVQLACVDRERKLTALPPGIRAELEARSGEEQDF